MENDIINSAIDIITPVMEGAMIAAAHYTKACGRNTVTAMDMKHGMRYCAMNLTGKTIGTMFPELQDEEDSDDDSDIEEVDEDDEPFTKYSGDDETMNNINKSFDEWADWEPFNPIEKLLKSAIDNSP